MKILIVNGPNLNLLGKRDRNLYGHLTLAKINKLVAKKAKDLKIAVEFFQSNHEGKLIDFLQKKARFADGILINPGAFTHYSYALRDALFDTGLPVVEAHLSKISSREDFRKIDVLDGIVIDKITGLKEKSYLVAFEKLVNYLHKRL